jgi:hypothetical protein
VTPGTNALLYAIEEAPPSGWEIAEVAGAGRVDAVQGKIKWGPFFDHEPRVVSYVVRIPAEAVGAATFRGAAAFDAATGDVSGERRLQLAEQGSEGAFVRRELPSSYSPGARMVVNLITAPPTDAGYHVVEDLPPLGWQVIQVSHGGQFDPVSRRVKFGPYFDVSPRVLSYEVIPPLTEAGMRQFQGLSLAGGGTAAVGGDFLIPFAPLHPADTQPIDAWMSMTEMTAYGAAWKRGTNWPFAPNPIPAVYVAHAVGLWRQGEGYAYDASVTNAPHWWVPRQASNSPVVAYGLTTTNGSATVTLPKFYQAGEPLQVSITALPATSVVVYAVEDRPPAGWTVSDIGEGGFLDSATEKVKWGPFFDAQQRILTYRVTPPAGAIEVGQFLGGAAFGGSSIPLAGRRQTFPTGMLYTLHFQSAHWLPTAELELTLEAQPGESYRIQTSTNLVQWEEWMTLTNAAGLLRFTDPLATNYARRYYRAWW